MIRHTISNYERRGVRRAMVSHRSIYRQLFLAKIAAGVTREET